MAKSHETGQDLHGALSSVCIAVPVVNESEHLPGLLEAIAEQSYSGPLETVVLDGGSTDGTRELVAGMAGVTLIDNPARRQAAAMNIAIERAQADIIVRMDARTRPSSDYVAECVEALLTTSAALVGGAQTPVETGSPRRRGIAAAMASTVGGGPAPFRQARRVAWVDTVYLGAFRRKVGMKAGGYRADLRTNEDAEFARRLQEHGGVLFTPQIRSRYLPRSRFQELAAQYQAYGRGRALTILDDPSSARPRQAIPLLLLLGLASPWRKQVLGAYALAICTAAYVSCRQDAAAVPSFMIAIPTMHLSWATGFLRSTVRPGSWRADSP